MSYDAKRYADAFADGWVPLLQEDTDRVVALLRSIAELEVAKKRYDFVRTLNASAFADIYKLNVRTGKPFDEIVDQLSLFKRGIK